MAKVTSIGGETTPIEIANEIPWDKLEGVIVIAGVKESDGSKATRLWCSSMTWADRVWMSKQLEIDNIESLLGLDD